MEYDPFIIMSFQMKAYCIPLSKILTKAISVGKNKLTVLWQELT